VCSSGSVQPVPSQEQCINCPVGQSSPSNASLCYACDNNTIADLPGTPLCIQCGANTVANPQYSQCVWDCDKLTFNVLTEAETSYNITKLSHWDITYGDSTIYASLCKHHPMCDNETYVCMIGNDTNMLDMGRIPAIAELPGSTGVSFTFTYGDVMWRGFGNNFTYCNTVVNMRCDPLQKDSSPVVYNDTDFDSDCVMVIEWAHRDGCPLCSHLDWSYRETACNDGKKTKTFYWTNQMCVDGQTLPEPEISDCQPQVAVNYTTVIVGVVLGVVALVAAAAGIGFLWWRHRKLYKDYSSLQNENVQLANKSQTTHITVEKEEVSPPVEVEHKEEEF